MYVHLYKLIVKISRFKTIIFGNKGGTIFSGSNTIATLELLTKVWGRKANLTGYFSDHLQRH